MSIHNTIRGAAQADDNITKHTSRTHLKTKRAGAIRDVLQELEDGAARTEVECQKCGHGFTYFNQLQIRSADEPMTIFDKYVVCIVTLLSPHSTLSRNCDIRSTVRGTSENLNPQQESERPRPARCKKGGEARQCVVEDVQGLSPQLKSADGRRRRGGR
ncbi:hypothetical protein C8J57DRAFT_1468701 [Mycena rebaudengoi]|nr:hypothetical protein C8J57DRAFT_1468701 [Mycena rebaudengoi]